MNKISKFIVVLFISLFVFVISMEFYVIDVIDVIFNEKLLIGESVDFS